MTTASPPTFCASQSFFPFGLLTFLMKFYTNTVWILHQSFDAFHNGIGVTVHIGFIFFLCSAVRHFARYLIFAGMNMYIPIGILFLLERRTQKSNESFRKHCPTDKRKKSVLIRRCEMMIKYMSRPRSAFVMISVLSAGCLQRIAYFHSRIFSIKIIFCTS